MTATEAIVGFRYWALVGGVLRGLARPVAWSLGTTSARCISSQHPDGDEARVPSSACTCGLYALHAPLLTPKYRRAPLVLGAIVAWGAVEVHRCGFRAEFAKPIALVVWPTAMAGFAREVRRAAAHHGADLIRSTHLRAAALEHGATCERLGPGVASPA